MAHADFVHLRARSSYSLSEGAIKIDDLVMLCRDHSMPAVAMTDHGNLFGALEFSQKASSSGIQPIIGCLLGVRDVVERSSPGLSPAPMILLAKDAQGYDNLLFLVSQSFLEVDPGASPHLDLEAIAERSSGLIALTGGPQGPVGRLLFEGQKDAAERLLGRLAEIFPDRLYMEIMRHGLPAEQQTEPYFLDYADTFNLPLVATNDIYFSQEDMYEAHDALLCIADGVVVSQSDRRRLTPDHRFKSADEMRALFADLPEAYANTVTVARRCAVFPEERSPLLPRFAPEEDEGALLRHQAGEGLEKRLASLSLADDQTASTSYRERLDYELQVIIEMGYAGYFLIVADFIGWAQSQAIPVGPGRGSGAGSVVAWALGITDLDPLRFGLLFERFLNPERVSMPDFDIDFCVERRDEVIHYVRDKYGQDRVAQIITFGTLQARAALRDVGRVLNLPYGQVDRVCKLVPFNPAAPLTLSQAIDAEPALQEARDSDPHIARMMTIALQLEGLTRHASTHAAGVVIGDRPLTELTPLYRDPRADMLATQFSMKYVEKAGLVKFDFLGLKTLTILEKAVDLVRSRDREFSLDAVDLDDAATYRMLTAGDTVGIFQLESAGMRDVLRRLKPDRFEDIIAVVALYRPGPMDNIPSFISRKHGREKSTGLDPRVDSVLSETYGIMIYQEQVMQIAQILAGYSLGAADLLRRAMGKKIRSEMDAQRQTFVDGAEQRGMSRPKAENVFEQMAKFAGYGFNKSHAAAYALVAYHTAYMKANYPVEFLAASMTCDLHNTDKLAAFRREARRLGIAVLPPDINHSQAGFTVEKRPGNALDVSDVSENHDGSVYAIRYGLAGVRHVGEQAMQALSDIRHRDGRFVSLGDFACRLDTRIVNKRLLENLVYAGGFDSLDPERARVFAAIEDMIRLAAAGARDRESGQENLFGGVGGEAMESEAPDIQVSEFTPWSPAGRLKHEYDALGFYLSAHPLDAYGPAIEQSAAIAAAFLEGHIRDHGGERKIKLAGVVLAKRLRSSQKGNRYAFVELSDPSGLFEVVIFSDVLAAAGSVPEPGSLVWLEVRGRTDGDRVRLVAETIRPLEEALREQMAGSVIRIHWTARHAGGDEQNNEHNDKTDHEIGNETGSKAGNETGKEISNETGKEDTARQSDDYGRAALDVLQKTLANYALKDRRRRGGSVVLVIPVEASGQGARVDITLPGRYRAGPEMMDALDSLSMVERLEFS